MIRGKFEEFIVFIRNGIHFKVASILIDRCYTGEAEPFLVEAAVLGGAEPVVSFVIYDGMDDHRIDLLPDRKFHGLEIADKNVSTDIGQSVDRGMIGANTIEENFGGGGFDVDDLECFLVKNNHLVVAIVGVDTAIEQGDAPIRGRGRDFIGVEQAGVADKLAVMEVDGLKRVDVPLADGAKTILGKDIFIGETDRINRPVIADHRRRLK